MRHIMTYKVGDKVAHPLHGAGIIDSIETHNVGGAQREYYVMRMPVGDMLVKVPKDTSDIIGVRPIMSREQVTALLNAIPGIQVEVTQNWNKRYRENMLRIRSGDLLEVAAVVKSLMLRDSTRGLSTGERKMLHSAKLILISEMALSQQSTYDEVERQLYTAMS